MDIGLTLLNLLDHYARVLLFNSSYSIDASTKAADPSTLLYKIGWLT